MKLFYRNNVQFIDDVMQWARTMNVDLTKLICVVGVKQSGCFAAAALANHFNCHFSTTDEIKAGLTPWTSKNRRRPAKESQGVVLLVDDTVCSGETMHRESMTLKSVLPQSVEVLRGAVYAMSQAMHRVDLFFKNVRDVNHVFEFNVMHHWFVERSFFDMDGVLCENWPYAYEDGDKADAYLHFLANARPLNIPSFCIEHIVTGRLEKYREVTEGWLRRHGVRWRNLTMHPECAPRDRKPAELKTDMYKKSDALLFVESCPTQSRFIASRTSRPVLSYEEQVMYNMTYV